MNMKVRGKILRDTRMGQGLITAEGRQYVFELTAAWKADCAPMVDMIVEVELTPDNRVEAIYRVPEVQLAKEQARQAAETAKKKGSEIIAALVDRFGTATLMAIAALIIGWFFLNILSVQITNEDRIGISFWKILGLVNSPTSLVKALGYGGSEGAGIYGFLALVALFAPITPYFWKDPRAHLGALLPLAYMLFVCLSIYWGIHDSIKQAQGAMNMFGGRAAAEMAAEMSSELTKQAMKALSIGLGTYLSVAASLYLAAKGTFKFLAAKA